MASFLAPTNANAPGAIFINSAKSSAPVTFSNSAILSFPNSLITASVAIFEHSLSFITAGVKYPYSNSASALYASAVDFDIRSKIVGIYFLSSGLNNLIVPSRTASLAITLNLVPEFKTPTLTTSGSKGLTSLLTMDCRFITNAELASTASTP